jgi:hypothetical protein
MQPEVITVDDDYPSYRRLTFLSIDACDFCDKVENPGPYLYYISFETKNGWVTCANEACKKKGQSAVDHYMRTKAYGKANCLKGKCIRIQRSSGIVEDNWKLSQHFIEPLVDESGIERVCVVNATNEIEKWVSVHKLIEFNITN